MLRNRRGFTGIEIAVVIAAVALLGYFTVPAVGKGINSIWAGTKNQSRQLHKLDEKYTIGRLDENGKFIKLGDYAKKEEMQNLLAQEPPEKWSTKVKIIIGFAIVLAIAFPGVALRAWLKAKDNLRQIITGIEQAKTKLPPEAITTLETSLSKKMDLKAKAEVKKIVPKIAVDDLK